MVSLKPSEMGVLDDAFDMRGGHVLDLSNRAIEILTSPMPAQQSDGGAPSITAASVNWGDASRRAGGR